MKAFCFCLMIAYNSLLLRRKQRVNKMNFSKKAIKIVFTTKIIIFIICFASTAYAELKIDSVEPTLGLLGQNLEVALTGKNFDKSTRVSMSLDTGNRRAIIGSLDLPGFEEDVTVKGNIGYVVAGMRLQVIDIGDPSSPRIIGSVETPGGANAVSVQDNLAYVVGARLQIIDISNSSNPQIIGSVDTPGDAAEAVTVQGNIAYLVDVENGLQMIDIRNPTRPRIISSVDTQGWAHDVTVQGNIAYLTDRLSGLQVIDVSDPSKPRIIGSVETPGSANGVTVQDNIAYVADDSRGLQAIDVSDPSTPQIIGSVDTTGHAWAVAVQGNIAYVADGGSGLQAIEISNPSSPQIIGSVETPGSARAVVVENGVAYVADVLSGLQIIDISNPPSFQIIGFIDMPDYAWAITVQDDIAYVADGWDGGLQAIDISNPSSLRIIGSIDTPGDAWAVAVQDDIAYVADGRSGGLQVIDISNPSSPRIIGSIDTPGYAWAIAIQGSMAYVADRYSGLLVIDVSNPSSPRIISSVATPSWANGVTVHGNMAYVADRYSGLLVIDISNPSSPRIIGSVDTPGDDAEAVTVHGNIAYVVDFIWGLHAIDISDPSSPRILGSAGTPNHNARAVTIQGNMAYVADRGSGLIVIDISNPSSPQILGSVDTPGEANAVVVQGNLAYLADGTGGFVIVPVSVEITPIVVNNKASIYVTLPSPSIAGHYTLRVFNEEESDDLPGAVTFTTNQQILQSKAIIVAGGGPNAPGEIWEETKQSANKAYDILVHEGYDRDSILYLSTETDNDRVNGPALHSGLEWAINTWASDASELLVFFVDHGLPDNFIVYATNGYSEQLNVDELDDWLDNLQGKMIGPITFIYDACYSGTFASKLVPPEGKNRIVITGASDEAAYFQGEDSFSFQFWEHLLLKEGNLGYAFSAAADIMQGYQSALINANDNSITNELEDFNIAYDHIIRRGQPIYLKPAPTIGNVIDDQTLNGSTSATIWVSDVWVSNVVDAPSVWAKIIPPDINPDIDGDAITDLPSIQLRDNDHNGTYQGTYHDFKTEGTYTIIANAQTSQEIYSYVQEAMVPQIIPSSPVYTSVTQMNGDHNIKADSYEVDDTYPQANVITLSDLDVQPHNFHDLGDVDWVKFYGLSGQEYSIKAINVNVICDVVIELFDSDGITQLKGPWNEAGDGKDEIMEWTCTRDDVYYVKLSNANATFGENCKYDLKLYRPIAPLVGFVTGIVKNAITRQALGNVQIKTSWDQSTLSHSDGSYLLVHEPGTFTVTAQLAHYNSKSYPAVQINEGDITIRDIVLDPSPTDTDKDGILDAVEYASSCLDANDADSDNDGIVDGQEDKNCDGIYDPGETNPCDQDTDGDQMPDGWEVQYNLNPLVDDASEDADGDGYSNLKEYSRG